MAATLPSANAVMSNVDVPKLGPAIRRTLRFHDLVHLLERGAAVEQFPGARVAAAAAQPRVILEQMRGEPERLFAQVRRCVGLVGEHGHDVLGFQHRTDAVADRLPAIGRNHLDRDAKMIADEFEQFSQPHRFHGVGKLGGRADRQIDEQVGRAGRQLLRHDRGDHLLAGVETQVDVRPRSGCRPLATD